LSILAAMPEAQVLTHCTQGALLEDRTTTLPFASTLLLPSCFPVKKGSAVTQCVVSLHYGKRDSGQGLASIWPLALGQSWLDLGQTWARCLV
jgi:hypothetical protein